MFSSPDHYEVKIGNSRLEFPTKKEADAIYNETKNFKNEKQSLEFFQSYLLRRIPQRAYITSTFKETWENFSEPKLGNYLTIENFYKVKRGTYFKFEHDNFGKKRMTEFVFDSTINDRVLGWMKIGNDWEYGDSLYNYENKICAFSGAEILIVKEMITPPNKFELPNINEAPKLSKKVEDDLYKLWDFVKNRKKKSDKLLEMEQQYEEIKPYLSKLTIDNIPTKIQALVLIDAKANRTKKVVSKEQVEKTIQKIWNDYYSGKESFANGGDFQAGVYAKGGSLQTHGIQLGDTFVKTVSGNIQKVKDKNGKIVYINLSNGERDSQPPLPFANGGGVSKRYDYGGEFESPRIYIANLEALNDNIDESEWLDFSDYNNADELIEAIQNLLDEWGVEEYEIQDAEYLPTPMGMDLAYLTKVNFEEIYTLMDVAKEKGISIDDAYEETYGENDSFANGGRIEDKETQQFINRIFYNTNYEKYSLTRQEIESATAKYLDKNKNFKGDDLDKENVVDIILKAKKEKNTKLNVKEIGFLITNDKVKDLQLGGTDFKFKIGEKIVEIKGGNKELSSAFSTLFSFLKSAKGIDFCNKNIKSNFVIYKLINDRFSKSNKLQEKVVYKISAQDIIDLKEETLLELGGGIGIEEEIDLTDDKVLRVRKPAMPEKELTKQEWSEKHNSSAYEYMAKGGFVDWQKYPTKKVRGLYEIKGDGINRKVNIVFFERYDDELYYLTPLDKDRHIFKGIFVKSTALNSLDKGLGVKGETNDGKKVLIKRISNQDFSYKKGGALIGNQKNIDLNKNGKIDADDFKLLRSSMNGAWRNDHQHVNSSNPKQDYEVTYARKHKSDRSGYKGKTNFAKGGGLNRSLVSGTSGRSVVDLPHAKYKITKEVTNAQVSGKNNVTYTNIVLPKGSIVHNLSGGVFVENEKLKEEFPTIYNSKYGLRIYKMEETLNEIYNNSEILEYANGGKVGSSNQNLEVELEAIINPDYSRNSHEGSVKIKKHRIKVKSLLDAQDKVLDFIDENDLGGGNFISANIFSNGKKIGRVSYNGRLWDLKEEEMKMMSGGKIQDDSIFNFNQTVDKWGGFDIGDGEYFMKDFKSLVESKPQFFIKVEKFNDYYETTYIPNPFQIEDLKNATDKDYIKLFSFAKTYRTSKLDVINQLKNNNNIGIYDIQPNKKTGKIVIDDMRWFYLGLDSCGSLISQTTPKKSPKYQELEKLYNENKPYKFSMSKGGETTFKEKSSAVAKRFVGKRVEPKYQKDYGKVYSKDEAKDVGNKIIGSMASKEKMANGGETKKGAKGGIMVLAKQIRKDGESWQDALKRAGQQLK